MEDDATQGKRLRLTVYLIKQSYEDVKDFLDVKHLSKVDVSSGDAEGTLFFKSGFKSQPPWVSIFADVPGFNPAPMVNQSCRAIYVLRVSDRWFCFAFGYTRHLIDESAIERNFGLRVSLNLGDPQAIKAIDKTSISHLALQSKEQAGRDVGFEGFEFDTDVDLLKSITAKAPVSDGESQETYSGRDSVSVYTRVDVEAFADIARRLYRANKSKKYQKHYSWIDRIAEVRDSGLREQLDDAVVNAINAGDHARIWLAVPEIVAWEEIDGFAFKMPAANAKKAGPVVHPDIDLEHWLDETGLKNAVTKTHLSSRKVYQCFKDARPPSRWSVYRCLNAEIDIGGKKYILNDGDWYHVDVSYVTSVEASYKAVASSSLTLPPFGTLKEPDYLEQVPKTHPQFAVMDRKNVMIGGGRNRVEFCDLYSSGGDIIHVKQYGGSSLLSHLFAQASVSAECFLSDLQFREDVNKMLPQGFKLSNPTEVPTAGKFTVCVAIMSKVPGPLEIPFFSKVYLSHAVKNLRRMGFKITKLKIER